MVSMWWSQDKVLSMVTSRYFALSVRRSIRTWIVYSESTTFRLLVMRMTPHLSVLNFTCQSWSHCCKLSSSSWSALTSAEELIRLYRRQSSAKRPVLDFTQYGRSLTYKTNGSGPMTVPWGTPDITGAAEDAVPSKTTCWILLSKNLFTHSKMLPQAP